ncbi:MAG: porin family protein [Salinarimonadaceae bacterium]|nr:MAG: porin family protein [Salinarimonadaceae bacterium]
MTLRAPSLFAALFGVAAAASPALAADLLPPLPDLDTPLITRDDIGAGWYLRGDVGGARSRIGRTTLSPNPGFSAFQGDKLGSAVTIGIGAGYRFNSWLRADVTVDHRFESRFTARNAALAAPGVAVHHGAKISATVALANLYFDLGTWSGLTPYVGAGVGVAGKTVSRYTIQGAGAPASNVAGRNRSDFVWALMGGVAIQVGYGASLDLGYRYLALGGAETRAAPATGATRIRNLESHEFRAGLRWSFH